MNNLAHVDGCSAKLCKKEGGVDHAVGVFEKCAIGEAVAWKVPQARLYWWIWIGDTS